MAFTLLEDGLLLKKIAMWGQEFQGGQTDPSGEIAQAIKATETQVKNALEVFRLALIATEEQSIVSLNLQIDQANDNIEDLTP